MKKIYTQGKNIVFDPSNIEIFRIIGLVILFLVTIIITSVWLTNQIIMIFYGEGTDQFNLLLRYLGSLFYILIIAGLVILGQIKAWRFVKYNLIKFKKNIH